MCFPTLKEYLQRTETLRVTGSQLLISFQKPHKAVSGDTISRWIRTVMQMSEINLDVYKAHSTPGQLQCLPPIGHSFLSKRFSAELGGHLLKLLPFIMTRIWTLQRVVPLSFRKLF